MHEVVQRIVHEAPQPPRPLRPEIDDELATIMLKCLSKERERRYQTAGELGRDVERYLRGEPIEAKRDSGWYVLRKSLRRFRAAVAIGALFVLLLMVSTAVGWTLWRKAEHSAVAEGQRAAEARENLRASLLAQARAVRKTGQAGQRFKALEAIAEAAAIRPGLELRNEMVAALAVTDVRIRPTALQIAGTTRFDASFERCAVLQEPGQSVCVVRLSDGLPIAHIPAIPPGSSEVYKLALAGDFLARVFDPPQAARRLEVWSIASGQLRWALDDVPPMGGFDISPDMTTLAVARLDSAVHLYDLATAAPLQRYALDRLPSRMNFDPAGRRLALFHGAYLSAEILDLHTGELCPAFGTTPISWSVAWTPDGRILAGASASNIQLWDTVDRRSIGALRGHDAVIIAMGTTHDGLRLASCSWDGVTILWDLSSRQALLQIDGNLTAFAPDDRAIGGSAPLTDGPPGRAGLAILDLVGPQEFSTLQVLGDPDTLAGNRAGFAARAGLVISSVANDSLTMPQRTGDPPFDPSGLYLLDPVSSRQLAHLPIGPSMLLSGPRNSDAEFFVSFHRGRGLYRWPIQAPGAGSERAVRVGPPQALLRTSSCEGAALAGNGRLGAISERFGEVTVVYVQRPVDPSRFDCTAGRVVRELSSDGRWVVVLGWHLAGGEVWDSAAGRRVAELALSSHGRAAFTSDDRRLVTIDALGLQVWDTASWQSIAARPGAYGLLSFSGDGRMLAVTGRDQKITLLDGRTLEELCMLEAPQRFATTDVTFGPAGSVVQMSNHAGLGYIWDLRAIRARLAEIGLDWSHPPLAPAEPRPAVQRVEVDLGELAGPGAE
jgi:WD40 repeat protein